MKRKNFLLVVLFNIIIIIFLIKIGARVQSGRDKLRNRITELEKVINIKKDQIERLIEEVCKCNIKSTNRRVQELMKELNITWKNGVAFRNGKAMLFDPKQTAGLFKSKKEIQQSQSEILKYSVFHDIANCMFFVFDSRRDDPYKFIVETEKILCYKISDNTLYLKDPLEKEGKWEPVKIRYIKEIKPDPDREDEQYPCMLVYLETKWFKGEYELECE